MYDDVALSCYIDSYKKFITANKGKIKRPYCSRFEDNMDVKTMEDDGSFENIDKIVWREDKNGEYRYSTIIHHTSFQSYKIEIKETFKEFYLNVKSTTTYHLTLAGSFKTNHFGINNYGRFYYSDLLKQINLIKSLGLLDSSKIKIDNLAPSVSILFDSPVLQFLKNSLLSYRNQPFKNYDPDKTGKIIGRYCPMAQLTIKIYDKSLQLGLVDYMMQFENSYNKMQKLNQLSIKYLCDLENPAIAYSPINILLKTFDDILLYDNTIDVNDHRLNDRQREMVKYGYSAEYWQRKKEEEKSSTYANRVKEFRQLSALYGSNPHARIRELIQKEWELLSEKAWTKLPGVKNNNLEKVTSTVGCNLIQVEDINCIIDNANMKDEKVRAIVPIMSNKQKQKCKKELKEKAYNKFQYALRETLLQLAA